MSGRLGPALNRFERRRAMRWGYVNGALWAIGNGLTTGTLVIYFARELGARGRDVGFILAVPALVGVLRLAAPALIRGLGGFKPAAFATYLPSFLPIACLPVLAFPNVVPQQYVMLVFVALICAHQLLDYIGTVAVWSWLAEIVPTRFRGRYFARRQRWQLLVLIPTLLASGLFADALRHHDASVTQTQVMWAYAAPIGLGALVLLASLIPLAKMPSVYRPVPAKEVSRLRILAPLGDSRFQRLLLFGCWFSFFNGLTQSAQNLFPRDILGLGVKDLAALHVLTQLGQIGLAPFVGSFSDRFGNKPTLIVCQLIVATGPLFYLLATPEQPWWIVGAWLAFSAYVGLNICLPNLMLKLAPGHDKSAYVATYFAITGLAYGVSTIVGGWLLDSLELFMEFERFVVGPFVFTRFGYLFYIAWVTRTLAVVLLFAIVEPGARTWRQILNRRAVAVEEPREAAEWA